jgi:Zn-dependent membrane protease YugP
MILDPLYFLVLAPAMLLSAWAAWATRSRFQKYAQVANHRRVSGSQAARYILDRNGLHDVQVAPGRGLLSDHYDPTRRVVRLSEDVYYGASVASLAVAAHEVGHAIQHQRNYLPLTLRNMAIPVANIGSNFGWFLILIGFLLSATSMIWAGVILFTGTVAFQVVTLPVELDASRRAKAELERLAIVSPGEKGGVSKVLSAAAMTYIGAALTGVLTLLYFLLRLGALSPREQ